MFIMLRFTAEEGDILKRYCDSTNVPGYGPAPYPLPIGPSEGGSKWSGKLIRILTN